MPELNLDALLRGYLDLKKTVEGQVKTWRLYDDMPTLTMLHAMHLSITEASAPPPTPPAESQSLTPDQLEQDFQAQVRWQQRLEEEVLAVFGEMFRHSFPEMTDEALAKLFTHRERYQVVLHFFRSRFSPSSPDSTGNTDASRPPTGDSDDQQTTTAEEERTQEEIAAAEVAESSPSSAA